MPSPCSWRCGTLRQAKLAASQGMEALGRGDAAQAEVLQRRALSLVFSLGGFPVLRAHLHNNLGVVLAQGGRHAEALREFSLALHLVRDRVDEDTRFHRALATNHRQTAALPQVMAA